MDRPRASNLREHRFGHCEAGLRNQRGPAVVTATTSPGGRWKPSLPSSNPSRPLSRLSERPKSMDEVVEWCGRISPPRPLRTGRETLASSGSYYPAVQPLDSFPDASYRSVPVPGQLLGPASDMPSLNGLETACIPSWPNAPALQACRGLGRPLPEGQGPRGLAPRQGEPEGAAVAGLAVDPDDAAHALHPQAA